MVVLGVNLALTYALQAALSQLMIISPDGKIIPFDNNASGIIVGETAAAVLIEPVENAIKSKRNIYAVIRSIGLSSDGSGGSVFAPCKEAQIKSYERTYRDIDPSTIDYIETHGTATQTGDDIEISTLNNFFKTHIDANRKIPIGSVKAIVGHTLAAAGMCALIKSLLMIKYKTIPPQIVEEKHSKIAKSCIDLPQEAESFSDNDRPLRIAISNFGLGGSNAHMVVESFDKKYYKKTNYKNVINTCELAIVDFEASMGSFSDVSQWSKMIQSGKNISDDFPGDRFNIELDGDNNGFFFPKESEIESMGLRMGPNLIKRVDPLQNFATHQINKLIYRNSGFKDSDDTGIVMCNNLGGGKTVSLSRKHFQKHKGVTIEENPGLGETTLEDITSSMANMFSGFPAFHFNLTGFHVTHSGGVSTFLTTLMGASEWLGNNCKVLLLGAAYYISSPIQLLSKSLDNNKKALMECAGTFAFKTLKDAESDNDKILAVIKNIIDCRNINSFEEVCKDTGYKPDNIDIREKINLAHDFENNKYQSYYLSEATGLDALTSIILKEGKIGTIEVYRKEKLLFVFFIEKRDKYILGKYEIKLPTKINFTDKSLGKLKKENFEKVQGENIKNRSLEMDDFLKWHESTSKGISLYLKMQTKLISLLKQNGDGKEIKLNNQNVSVPGTILDVSNVRKNPNNIVIGPVNKVENLFSTNLIVNEEHPYFFDHPLDHVPGILMTEGFLQLIEIVLENFNFGTENNFFIKFCDLNFTKWCEKDQPIQIILKVEENNKSNKLKFNIEFKQNSDVVCKTNVILDNCPGDIEGQNLIKEREPEKLRNKELVHKKKVENVLISDFDFYNIKNKKFFKVDVLQPGQEHLISDGDKKYKTLLFFMEISRQFLNLYAHTQEKVNVENVIMTQLSNTVEMNRPINFDEEISLIHYNSEKQKVENTYFSKDDVVALDAMGNEIGKCTVLAQIQERVEYQKDRN